jgi:hypothetical protein
MRIADRRWYMTYDFIGGAVFWSGGWCRGKEMVMIRMEDQDKS